jgi:hypothetical protein
MKSAEQAARALGAWIEESARQSSESARKRTARLQEYLLSEEFEGDLDELARRLEIDYRDFPRQKDWVQNSERLIRVRSKALLLLGASGQKIASSVVNSRTALPLLLARPKLARPLGLALAAFKSAEILKETLDVFYLERKKRVIEVSPTR